VSEEEEEEEEIRRSHIYAECGGTKIQRVRTNRMNATSWRNLPPHVGVRGGGLKQR
jgi:hypothetical protein